MRDLSEEVVLELFKTFSELGSIMNKKMVKKIYNRNEASTLWALGPVEYNPKLSQGICGFRLDISKNFSQNFFNEIILHPLKPAFLNRLELGDETIHL